MKQTFTLLVFFLTITLTAQEVVDFENFNLSIDESLNGSDGNGGFTSGNLFFSNSYNADFQAWSDWGISAQTDTITPGFMNDLSAFAGTGAAGTTTYAVSSAFSPTQIKVAGDTGGSAVFEGMYVTNNTYAALSMAQGDAFAKKFGGETGDDEDFFLLTIQKYLNGELGSEVVQFFLADYRSADNTQDFIIQDWTFVDLTPLGEADSLVFSLSSSDNGQFGMNTPAYFCVDQISFSSQAPSTQEPSSSADVDFENFNLAIDESLNGSDGNGGFTSGNLFFSNSYNADFNAWSDWGISAQTDTITPGFMNDLSAFAGTGAAGTTTYAVSSAFSPTQIKLAGETAGSSAIFEGMYITNNTYAALSMAQGDAFAKKFGGETGDDEDFFLLTIQKYLDGELGSEVVQFFLADYRSADNTQDFIIQDWTFVDLTSLGEADSLVFSLSSSDNGQFGMNTPAYFCVDEISFSVQGESTTTSVKEVFTQSFELFPNPAADYTNIHWSDSKQATAAIFSMTGQQVQQYRLQNGNNQLNLATIPAGIYSIRILDRVGWQPQMLVVK